jgi:N-acyl homoserine lactone hydrolase
MLTGPASHTHESTHHARIKNVGDVRRIDLGYFVRPADEAGAPHPRVEPVYGYLVRRPEGLLLFDTGMGADPEVDAHYQPTRRPLTEALQNAGVSADDVTMVVNCHLHFDHCGGNPLFAGRPIVVQRTELAVARTSSEYMVELVDFDGAHYLEVSGETELWPGVWIIPTPGHTDGHQSVAVRRADGTVVLAGQARDDATTYGRDLLAHQSGQDIPYPKWVERLVELDPRAIVFAHDAAVWMPGERKD